MFCLARKAPTNVNGQKALENHPPRAAVPKAGTLEGRGGGLGHLDVLLGDQVDGLVLRDLHTRAHVALPVQEEREGTRQVLTAGQRRQKGTFIAVNGLQEGNSEPRGPGTHPPVLFPGSLITI